MKIKDVIDKMHEEEVACHTWMQWQWTCLIKHL